MPTRSKPLSDREREVLAGLDRLSRERPGEWLQDFHVYPLRGNLWTAQRRTLRRLAERGFAAVQRRPGYAPFYRALCQGCFIDPCACRPDDYPCDPD